ncbi:MAG: tyrosine-type recombinase/integrase [Burkholderiaceae bacterium]|nr:tyrosine-type recombinase/integrase [Burkholderiaceae bacterium]
MTTRTKTIDTPYTGPRGLYVRTGHTGQKRYIVKGRLRGHRKVVTFTLGSADVIGGKQAVSLAKEILAKLSSGIDPNDERREAIRAKEAADARDRARSKTFGDCVEDYFAAKTLRPRTVKDMRSSIDRLLSDWLDKPAREIAGKDVLDRYLQIESSTKARAGTVNKAGAAQAKKVFAYVSSIMNFVRSDDVGGEPLLQANPVEILKHKRVRKALKPRERYLTGEERRRVLDELSIVVHPEYGGPLKQSDASLVALLLFTGLRINEALGLRWEDVDVQDQLLTFKNTKNGSTHRLPITDSIGGVLAVQRATSISSPFVFPSPIDPARNMTAERSFERLAKATGVNCSAHDLRRTVASVSAELGFDLDAIGRVLNHSSGNSVTARYVQTSIPRIRTVLEQLENALWEDYRLDGEMLQATPEAMP